MQDISRFLQYADQAQQAFLSSHTLSLHNALPAIEALHAAWSKKAESTRAKYKLFKEGLVAAMEKLEEYYEKTAQSDVHIFAMGIDPPFHIY